MNWRLSVNSSKEADILNRCNELQKAYKYFQNKTIPVLFPASLGKYSADNEEFIMNFLNRSLALKVKRDIAPTLIQKRDISDSVE